MKAAQFTYHAPRSLPEAVRLLGELAEQDARILAGGQSLVPMMAFRVAQPAHLIDINRIDELAVLRRENGHLRVGALARHAQFGRPVADGPLGALLAHVADHIAHAPIRTRGTLCGSLAHADPSSEWCLIAVTLGAEVEAHSTRGLRTIPADGLLAGLMTTTLAADEIIACARIPLLPAATRWGFSEFSRRRGDYAMAMALVTLELDRGVIARACVGIGGAEDRPRRNAAAEACLIGKAPDQALFKAAADAAAASVEPMEDLQATAGYRRDLVGVVVERALEQTL